MTLDPSLPPVAPPPLSGPTARRGNAIWLLELVPLAFGIFVGRQMAYEMSIPGNELGGIGPFVLAFFISVIVGVVGLVLAAMRRGRPAAMAFAAAAVLVVGTVGTFKVATALGAGAADLGITYRPPVVIHSIGTTEITLVGATDFSGGADNGASCASMDDSTVIGSVQTLAAGELGGGSLRATLTMDTLGNSRISLWIDGADVPEGETQPMWEGAATLQGATTGNVSGDADFTNVAQGGVDAGKGLPPAGGSWPAMLTGSLHWTCRP